MVTKKEIRHPHDQAFTAGAPDLPGCPGFICWRAPCRDDGKAPRENGTFAPIARPVYDQGQLGSCNRQLPSQAAVQFERGKSSS